jgi:hypothetical protein
MGMLDTCTSISHDKYLIAGDWPLGATNPTGVEVSDKMVHGIPGPAPTNYGAI